MGISHLSHNALVFRLYTPLNWILITRGGGWYSITIAIRVCAAQWGRIFGTRIIFQMHESFKILSVILTVEWGKQLPIFLNRVSLQLQILCKMGSSFGGLGGTHPPKTYSGTPCPPPQVSLLLSRNSKRILINYENKIRYDYSHNIIKTNKL